MNIPVGEPLPLAMQLQGGDTDKFVRARVYNPSGNEIAGSPFALTHRTNGLYTNSSVNMPNLDHVFAQLITYDDSGFTTPTEAYGPFAQTFARLPESEGGGGGDAGDVGVLDTIVGIVREV